MYLAYASRYHRSMQEIGSREARSEFREWLNRVEVGGEHIAVVRHGKPAAVWVPAEWYERAKAALEREEQAS